MTLLERFDKMQLDGWRGGVELDEIRRALAIAQAANEMASEESYWTVRQVMRRADKLLEGK